jgi:hypothetical protein
MSLLSPAHSHRGKHAQTQPNKQPTIKYEFPPFESRAQVKVVPFDKSYGEVVERAVSAYGPQILAEKFGVKDAADAYEQARLLAEKSQFLGLAASRALEPTMDAVIRDDPSAPGTKREQVYVIPRGMSESEQVAEQVEAVWEEKALVGDEAMLALYSLERMLDRGPVVGHMLDGIRADDTRIAFK